MKTLVTSGILSSTLPLKSQLMTFGGNNPSRMTLSMNGVPLSWVSKVKYLGVSFLCNTGKIDMSDTIRKFYSQFNNIMSVLGKGSQEMNAVHLMKTYCLPTLTYGIENSAFCDNILDIKYRLSGITVSVVFSPVAGVKV